MKEWNIEEEKKLLSMLASGKTIKEVAGLLGRTPQSIKGKSSKLKSYQQRGIDPLSRKTNHHPLSDKQKKKILSMVEKGKKLNEIAESVGATYTMVYKFVKGSNMNFSSTNRALSQEVVDSVLKLKKNGAGAKAISLRMGINLSTVYRIIHKNEKEQNQN